MSQDKLDFFARPPQPAPIPPQSHPRSVRLYTVERLRERGVSCRVCQKQNHETRLWCTHCGHQLGVPLSECVCESCVYGV